MSDQRQRLQVSDLQRSISDQNIVEVTSGARLRARDGAAPVPRPPLAADATASGVMPDLPRLAQGRLGNGTISAAGRQADGPSGARWEPGRLAAARPDGDDATGSAAGRRGTAPSAGLDPLGLIPKAFSVALTPERNDLLLILFVGYFVNIVN